MDLKQAVGIVTGSSSGVGASTARQLAARGTNVVINYSRSVDAAERVAEECRELGAEVLVCQADVSKDSDCQRMVEDTLSDGVALISW